ncbi:hypothetical protein HX001_10225 [Empedobacter brevis]|uniref:Uncharacterized protein n=1 Tax=Empedobacter brevis TaxID=247 RepID=A0AAJ1V883_9FLAO|nr:hypothetical protein [Empedobacter brevis]MDM1072862.1 hypothetical protein [Empedobacter brevis]
MTNDYLRDLDDWDEESQQILLSLAKENAFLSFKEMEKGVFGKDSNALDKVTIDRKVKRGETHRGLTNVHPFATQYRNNLDIKQIDHRYFIDASKTTYNNVSVITDVDTENQALEVIKKEFYIDHNLNGVFDAGEYVFHLIIFQSKDGNKVNEAYQASSQPNSNEIVLYLEQGQDVFSSQKMYAKVGEGIWKKVLSKDNVYKNTLWKVLNEYLKFNDKELIFELLEKGQIEGNVIISTFLKGINITLQVLSAPAFAVGWLIEKIGEGLDLLKLPSTIWDVNGDGYFFEKDKLLQKLTISTEKINQLQQTILEDKAYQAFLPNMIELILDGMMNKLRNTVTNYNKWVTNKVTEISEAMIKNPEIQNELLHDIALLCGIWDGIVDTFSSAVLFTGQVAQSAFKAATNIDELLETIDNIFDFLTSGKVWESISSFFIKMREELSDIDLADIDLVKASYILGFGIVFIAGFFIPLTALGKVGKIGSLGAKFSEMLTEVGKVVRTFPEAMKSKTVVQQINRLLDVFSSSEKTRNHAQEIAQAIKKWLVKNKGKYQELARYGKALLERTAKTYAKIYPDGKLYKILKLREAYRLYGKLGKILVKEVDITFENTIKLRGYKEKVMISGMLYKGDKGQKVFSAVNFTKNEIQFEGKLTEFIENMHPVLKKRYELHLKEITKGLKATPEMIKKAGIAASHGEIRAVNDLLYYLESTGMKVTDDVFKDIMGYNRYLIKEGSQPPCVHCFYLTDGIVYLKLLK